MAKTTKRYTLTAALPYANGPVHIGHLAGVYIPADIFARYQRLQGHDVAFICGSDEHGVPITIRAKKEGVSPQQIVDKYHALIKNTFSAFGISFDNYSRTSAPIHHDTAAAFFSKLDATNQFIKKETEQLYDAEAKQFLADRFIIGTCPKCGNPESYGDQCESCGTSHNATDLINPKSALTGHTPIRKNTTHWFLPLDQHQEWLSEWILKSHTDWKPNVYGQCKSWLTDGLKPRAVTRDLNWGIPVPLKNAEGKVLYVWFDAPIGYISATKEWAQTQGKDWTPYWKDKNTELIHFIGKDNIVFHCIIFPAMLKAEGSYILPTQVPANEFLNLEGEKISTSKNWAVWLHEYLEDFPNQEDVLRYVLTANAPETKDNDFTWRDFQARNNNELVAIFGNFVNRVMVLTHKYYGGYIPEAGKLLDEDLALFEVLQDYPKIIGQAINQYRFREAQQLWLQVARLGNKYLADQEPWKLYKTAPERTQTILYVSMQITALLAVLSEPFLPHTSKKLKDLLCFDKAPDKNAFLWNTVGTQLQNLLPTKHKVEPTQLLFNKIDDAAIVAQTDKLNATKMANQTTEPTFEIDPQKDTIQFDAFTPLDIRVGTILTAEKMPKTDKLMILKVDTGLDTRTIVSGIAQAFSAEELIGKQVTVLINLAPRKLRGVESQGMILLAETNAGKLEFISPENAVANGAIVR